MIGGERRREWAMGGEDFIITPREKVLEAGRDSPEARGRIFWS